GGRGVNETVGGGNAGDNRSGVGRQDGHDKAGAIGFSAGVNYPIGYSGRTGLGGCGYVDVASGAAAAEGDISRGNDSGIGRGLGKSQTGSGVFGIENGEGERAGGLSHADGLIADAGDSGRGIAAGDESAGGRGDSVVPTDDDIGVAERADIELDASGFVASALDGVTGRLPTTIIGARGGIVGAAVGEGGGYAADQGRSAAAN